MGYFEGDKYVWAFDFLQTSDRRKLDDQSSAQRELDFKETISLMQGLLASGRPIEDAKLVCQQYEEWRAKQRAHRYRTPLYERPTRMDMPWYWRQGLSKEQVDRLIELDRQITEHEYDDPCPHCDAAEAEARAIDRAGHTKANETQNRRKKNARTKRTEASS
jgi:hypothetical protein